MLYLSWTLPLIFNFLIGFIQHIHFYLNFLYYHDNMASSFFIEISQDLALEKINFYLYV